MQRAWGSMFGAVARRRCLPAPLLPLGVCAHPVASLFRPCLPSAASRWPRMWRRTTRSSGGRAAPPPGTPASGSTSRWVAGSAAGRRPAGEAEACLQLLPAARKHSTARAPACSQPQVVVLVVIGVAGVAVGVTMAFKGGDSGSDATVTAAAAPAVQLAPVPSPPSPRPRVVPAQRPAATLAPAPAPLPAPTPPVQPAWVPPGAVALFRCAPAVPCCCTVPDLHAHGRLHLPFCPTGACLARFPSPPAMTSMAAHSMPPSGAQRAASPRARRTRGSCRRTPRPPPTWR